MSNVTTEFERDKRNPTPFLSEYDIPPRIFVLLVVCVVIGRTVSRDLSVSTQETDFFLEEQSQTPDGDGLLHRSGRDPECVGVGSTLTKRTGWGGLKKDRTDTGVENQLSKGS